MNTSSTLESRPTRSVHCPAHELFFGVHLPPLGVAGLQMGIRDKRRSTGQDSNGRERAAVGPRQKRQSGTDCHTHTERESHSQLGSGLLQNAQRFLLAESAARSLQRRSHVHRGHRRGRRGRSRCCRRLPAGAPTAPFRSAAVSVPAAASVSVSASLPVSGRRLKRAINKLN